MTARIGWWLSMAVSIDGAGSLTGLDAVDVPVYADVTARNTAIASPVAGQIVFVTGTGSLVYNGTAWVALGAGAANFTNTATGTYTDGGLDYKFITFTGSGNLVVDRAGFADLLLVGGGGSGGSSNNGGRSGGGGGAGGYYEYIQSLEVGTYTVSIGAGGASDTSGSLSSVFIFTAIGGGRGGPYRGAASSGFSGGSGGGASADAGAGGSGANLLGSNGANFQSANIGGGGGGKGAAATNANGGGGGSSTLTNVSVTRSGGGGAGNGVGSGSGTATAGGGSGSNGSSVGGAGSANTGGGGGGGAGGNPGDFAGGAGGSGIIVVRVRTN